MIRQAGGQAVRTIIPEPSTVSFIEDLNSMRTLQHDDSRTTKKSLN